MAITYGLTVDGFVKKPSSVILTELQSAWRLVFGPIDLSVNTIEGQILALVADREGALWDQMQNLYSSQDPDSVGGQAQDQLCLLTGTFRQAPTFSAVTLSVTGADTTPVAAGFQASAVSTGAQFITGFDAVLAAVPAWVHTTVYALASRVSNGGNVYVCVTAGTSAGSGGPSGTGPAIVDGSVLWRWMGAGTSVADVVSSAVLEGPIAAVSGDLTHIDTSTPGVSGVINLEDAVLGTNLGSDEGTRLLREDELEAAGNAPFPALLARLLETSGVTAVTLFANNSDFTTSDGLGPHSVEALVQGGADADIRATLFRCVGIGIGTHGTTSGTVIDSQGGSHTINHSRPEPVPIYVILNLTYDASVFPADGAQQVSDAVLAYGKKQKTGRDAVSKAIGAPSFSVLGVLDAEALIGLAPTPTLTTTIAITTRQLATYDTSRLVINLTPGTP